MTMGFGHDGCSFICLSQLFQTFRINLDYQEVKTTGSFFQSSSFPLALKKGKNKRFPRVRIVCTCGANEMGKKGGSGGWSAPVGSKSHKNEKKQRKQKQQQKQEADKLKQLHNRNPEGGPGSLLHAALGDRFGQIYSYLNAPSQGALRSTCYEMFLRFNTAVYYEHHLGIVASRSGLLQKALEKRESVWFPVSYARMMKSKVRHFSEPSPLILPANWPIGHTDRRESRYVQMHELLTEEEINSNSPIPDYEFGILPSVIVDLEMLPHGASESSTAVPHKDATLLSGGGGGTSSSSPSSSSSSATQLFFRMQGIMRMMIRSCGNEEFRRQQEELLNSQGPWARALGPCLSAEEEGKQLRSGIGGNAGGVDCLFNDCISSSNPGVECLPDRFLSACPHLEEVFFGDGCDSIMIAQDHLLGSNRRLKNVDFSGLSQLRSIGNYFLAKSEIHDLSFAGLDRLLSVGDSWMESCEGLRSIQWTRSLRNLKFVGDKWLAKSGIHNVDFTQLALPPAPAPGGPAKKKQAKSKKSDGDEQPEGEELQQKSSEYDLLEGVVGKEGASEPSSPTKLDQTRQNSEQIVQRQQKSALAVPSTSFQPQTHGEVFSSLQYVGAGWMRHCDQLLAAVVGGMPKLEAIGYDFFYNCTHLQSVKYHHLPNLETIGDCWHQSCADLEKLDLSELGMDTCFSHYPGFAPPVKEEVPRENEEGGEATKQLGYAKRARSMFGAGRSSLSYIGKLSFSHCLSLKTIHLRVRQFLPEIDARIPGFTTSNYSTSARSGGFGGGGVSRVDPNMDPGVYAHLIKIHNEIQGVNMVGLKRVVVDRNEEAPNNNRSFKPGAPGSKKRRKAQLLQKKKQPAAKEDEDAMGGTTTTTTTTAGGSAVSQKPPQYYEEEDGDDVDYDENGMPITITTAETAAGDDDDDDHLISERGWDSDDDEYGYY